MSPHLIQAYMETFCNCCRITMLMHRVPWRTILQVSSCCCMAYALLLSLAVNDATVQCSTQPCAGASNKSL
jgi:hypothetical protein